MTESALAPMYTASFRDPGGRVLQREGRILRVVRLQALRDLERFLESPASRQFVERGNLVQTSRKDPPGAVWKSEVGEAPGDVWFEHERIPFPSHPYEWPPEMLYQAGRLTLELALTLLKDGLGLKDATPYNVLFRGPRPVFVDVLSVESRDPQDPVWTPYAQFVRTFLLPLAVNRDFGMSIGEVLSGRRDGLEPQTVDRWLGPVQRLRRPYLTLVSLPARLSGSARVKTGDIYQRRQLSDPRRARFVLEVLLKGLDKHLRRLEPTRQKHSLWSHYMETHSYTEEHFAAKEEFIEDCLREFAPASVLDAGCNDGYFSRMAARAGARVVSIDYEEAVVGKVWHRAAVEDLDILPLVVNLTRPTPAMGWHNRENASFLDRARGAFDAVFMLALIHHMLVSERVPLEEIIKLAAELSSDIVVMEYVSPADAMFRQLARGREHLHQDLTEEKFEAACRKHFEIVRSRPLKDGHRRVYLLRKRM